MKNAKNMIVSILITIVIFILAVFLGNKINLNFKIFPSSFYMHTCMLILGILAIYFYKRKINFQIKLPKFKTIFLPSFLGLLAGILGNILIMIIFISLKVKPQMHPMVATMTPLQRIIFIFLYASICEEVLFRGFLLNSLNNIKNSISIVISALLFGLAHITLLAFGAKIYLVVGIVISTIILGFVASYYQKKYNNLFYAIIVHMAGNFPLALTSIVMMLK